MSPEPQTTASFRTHARVAGLLYVLVILCAGFAQGFVRGTLVVPGDAAATAANIVASENLFRLGLVADLVAFVSDAVVAVLLYVLLRPVSRTASLVAAALRLVAHPAIASLNLLNHWAALRLLTGGGAAALEPGQLPGAALMLMEAHGVGYLLAGAFFGLHLLVLGWLLWRSDLFPRTLGILVAVAAAGYLLESFGSLLLPDARSLFTWIVGITAVIGEVSLALYLLVKGVRTPRPTPLTPESRNPR